MISLPIMWTWIYEIDILEDICYCVGDAYENSDLIGYLKYKDER